jgi:hypothetical protein
MSDARFLVDDETVARIAEASEATPRSVWKRLAGGRIRGRVQARIDRAIAEARAVAGSSTPAPSTPADTKPPVID